MEKIARVRKLVGPEMDIQVDGGVTPDNAAEIEAAGANIVVAGSAVFSKSDYGEAIAALRGTNA
jgi:ribulose-phosphate 3-epimerase